MGPCAQVLAVLPPSANMSPAMRTSAMFIRTNRAVLSHVALFGSLADALCSSAVPTVKSKPVVTTLSEQTETMFCAPRAARANLVPRIDTNGRFSGCPVSETSLTSAGAQLANACCPPAQSASVEEMMCPYGCRPLMAASAFALGSSCFENVRRLYYGQSAVVSSAGTLEAAWTTLIGSENCSGGFGIGKVEPVPGRGMPGASGAGAVGSIKSTQIWVVVALALSFRVL